MKKGHTSWSKPILGIGLSFGAQVVECDNSQPTVPIERGEVPNNLAHEERRGVDRITDEERARNDSVNPRVEPKTRKGAVMS